MENAFHKLDHLAKNQAVHWDWIKYLEAERKILMARIDDLEGIVSQIVNDYADLAQAKQAQQELEDRMGAAADKLRDAHATLMGQAGETPAPAPPQSQQAAPDMGVVSDEPAR